MNIYLNRHVHSPFCITKHIYIYKDIKKLSIKNAVKIYYKAVLDINNITIQDDIVRSYCAIIME